MYEALRRWTLAIMKAPGEPQPPLGDPASLRVFRAGQNYFRLRLAGWAVAELVALGGLIFWTAFLIDVEVMARTKKAERAARAEEKSRQNKDATAEVQTTNLLREAKETLQTEAKAAKRSRKKDVGWADFKNGAAHLASVLPAGAFVWIWGLKILSALIFLAQLPLTYAVRRLDYEMRWYLVTDRSLRLRHGVWQISESTMSFANVQQVVVSQGPLQRLLGLGDVKVTSAGGGGGRGTDSHGSQQGTDMHTGLFHCVTNAQEIRDLILERLRRFRETGLGDPDERVGVPLEIKTAGASPEDAIVAARQLLEEARALRSAMR